MPWVEPEVAAYRTSAGPWSMAVDIPWGLFTCCPVPILPTFLGCGVRIELDKLEVSDFLSGIDCISVPLALVLGSRWEDQLIVCSGHSPGPPVSPYVMPIRVPIPGKQQS